MYEIGRGVKKDYKKAAEYYQESADKGNADAQHNLALMYKKGKGVKKDYKKAIALYKKAANQGNVFAQYSLDVMYDESTEDEAKLY